MSKIQTAILMLIMSISGVFGAAFAGWMIRPETVKANDGVIEAHSFQVADSDGYVKMLLSTTDAGDPFIAFYDKNGLERLMFQSVGSSPMLSFWDKNGKVRLAGAVLDDGASSLELVDNNDKVIWSKP